MSNPLDYEHPQTRLRQLRKMLAALVPRTADVVLDVTRRLAMLRAWIAVALLSASWLLGTGHFYAPNWVAWAIVIAAAIALLPGVIRRMPAPVESAITASLLIPGIVVMPSPQRLAPALMAVGLALSLLPRVQRWLRPIASALFVAGSILLVQAITLLLYEATTARMRELPPPVPQIANGIAQLLDMEAGTDGLGVTLSSMRRSSPIGMSAEVVLDPATVCFALGGVTLLALLAWSNVPVGQRRRYLLRAVPALLGCIIVWMPLRLGLMLSLYLHRVLRTDYDEPIHVMNQFVSPWVLAALLLGPALLAWHFVSASIFAPAPQPVVPAAPQPLFNRRRIGALICIALGAALFTVGLFWEPIGSRRPGRVMVDEVHSNWERTDKPFDTEWYGHLSSYNYAVLYDYCSRFYDMSRITTPIDDMTLDDCDVLILKIPTERSSPEEVKAVCRYVERGGSVMLIGEHTDVWGSGTFLNDVAKRMGFSFRYDVLFGLDSHFDQHYPMPVVPHPMIQNMGPLDFAGPCSIDTGASIGRAVIRSTGLRSVMADYHASNFYPQVEDYPDARYGAFINLWATRYGKGRVAAFADSTIFSNFSFFEPGKSELMLGMIEWLNHRDTSGPWSFVLLIFSGALLVAGFVLARGWGGSWTLVVAAIVLGWSAAVFTVNRANASAMPLPQAQRPMTRIMVDRSFNKPIDPEDESNVILPKGGFIAGRKEGFGIFERWILRLGYFTKRTKELDSLRGDLVIFIHPNEPVKKDFRAALHKYVEAGGKVLVFDSPDNAGSTANQLLEPFEMSFGDELPQGDLKIGQAWPEIDVTSARRVSGGETLCLLSDQPVASRKTIGNGSVTALGFSSRFNDPGMGVTGDVVPDDRLRAIYDLQYELLRAIVENRPLADRPPPRPATAPSTAPSEEP